MIPKHDTFSGMAARIFPEWEAQGRRIRSVTLQVTEDCNLRCSYCYQTNKTHHHMPLETAKAFLNLLLDGAIPSINPDNCGGIALELIGGEPFLEIDFMDQVCAWFIMELIQRDHPWKNFFRFSISSNGTTYFDPRVQVFLKKYGHWVSLSISVDGNKTLHDRCRVFPDGRGSYDLAVKAAQHWASRSQTLLSTKMTLSPDNIAYTADAVVNLIQIGYRLVYVNCVYEEGWTLTHARTLYRQMRKLTDWLFEHNLHDEVYIRLYDADGFCPLPTDGTDEKNYCGGTGEMLAMDWRGILYPCLRYMPSSLGDAAPPLELGRMVDGKLQITQAQERCERCLKSITRRSQSSDACYHCPIAKGCAWCSAYNYQVHGTANQRATFICDMHKARALANFEFWNRYYRTMGMDCRMENHMKPEWIDIIRGGGKG